MVAFGGQGEPKLRLGDFATLRRCLRLLVLLTPNSKLARSPRESLVVAYD